ncbi:nitrogen-specific signal transduction histidine kinase [Tumebacillus sp. BK434]|uniref:two-component system sensor histidine kinase NtrB n=1 Tax=Tumebacillus sp. BK434 TaxID=2512169 RepID=UPI00104C2353|nr:ATP-binding protein [Tumebacillus sp. BK434]TCP52646.1 nitrogen-specific signal transduction histidine kinase [Tumebacillus sp. BK434]
MKQTSEMTERYSGLRTPQFRVEGLDVETYHDGVVVLDLEMNVLAVNKTAADFLPGDWSGELPKQLRDVFPEMTEEYEWLSRLVRERSCFRNHIVNLSRDGKLRTLLSDSSFLREADGAQAGICLFLKDIGNIVSLEQKIQHNEILATVGKIAAGVAHEIRNPLTSIKGFLQIMRHELDKQGMKKEFSYTDVMLAEIDRVNELVGELLLLSKPRELRMEHLEMEELIMAMAPLISSESLLHNIEFHLSLKSVPKVYADPEMLKQVLLNLVKNAIESMSETAGGKMVIATDYLQGERMVRVDVQDTGPGIPHYLVDRIFDAFFTTKETGTGLGLPICQRLVNDLGGRIKVKTKGYGTTFSVFLPALAE